MPLVVKKVQISEMAKPAPGTLSTICFLSVTICK